MRANGSATVAAAKHRKERLLGDLHAAHPLHALLALSLLLEQLPLARDIATVALGEDVLPHRPDRLPGDDVRADRRLDRDLEHLARDERAQLLDERTPGRRCVVPVHDEA